MVAKNILDPVPSLPSDAGIVELSLMLSRSQFHALEQRAREAGLSVAQFLRRLVHESISEELVGSQAD